MQGQWKILSMLYLEDGIFEREKVGNSRWQESKRQGCYILIKTTYEQLKFNVEHEFNVNSQFVSSNLSYWPPNNWTMLPDLLSPPVKLMWLRRLTSRTHCD